MTNLGVVLICQNLDFYKTEISYHPMLVLANDFSISVANESAVKKKYLSISSFLVRYWTESRTFLYSLVQKKKRKKRILLMKKQPLHDGFKKVTNLHIK